MQYCFIFSKPLCFFDFVFDLLPCCFFFKMASPLAYSSNSEEVEAETHKVSRLAKGKRRHSEQGQASKDVHQATKKCKFQTSLEMSDKYPVTKLLLPRYVNFEDPQFCLVCSRLLDIFKCQGWMEFMSEYRVYYPRLVFEFFQNFQSNEKKSKFWSIVKEVKIKISVRSICLKVAWMNGVLITTPVKHTHS